MKAPRGFLFSGIHAGIKASRKDFALIAAEVPCSAAARFTRNAAAAAPVLDARARFPSSAFRALVITSGNANALTGAEGIEDCRAVCARVADELRVPHEAVVCAATGVIGVRWPVDKLLAASRELVESRSPHLAAAAEAILTTDTRVKLALREATIGGRSVQFAAIAKGSGMVAPSLATVLVVFTTDAHVPPAVLDAVLGRVCARTFEQLDLDGSQSTNDAVLLLASGLAGHAAIASGSPEELQLESILEGMAQELCGELAEDGEGATRRLDVTVRGAASDDIARNLARAVAGDNLVKAALFGSDPNWGRVVAALGARIGRDNLPVELQAICVQIAGIQVFAYGVAVAFDSPSLRKRMRDPLVLVEIALGGDAGSGRAWGCDLSYDYVKINGDYASFTQASSDGTITRDDRIGNYSPALKRAILVEALSYIAKFANRRVVIAWVGSALSRPALAATLASDVSLLQSAGVLPLVVHGYPPAVHAILESPGAERALDAQDAHGEQAAGGPRDAVDTLLEAQTGPAFVAALNQHHAHAIGICGREGGVVRAFVTAEERADGNTVHAVRAGALEVLLGKGYVPVVSPVGVADDGSQHLVDPAELGAHVAAAVRADKLIILVDAPGLTFDGELIVSLHDDTLADRLRSGGIHPALLRVVHAALAALRHGVHAVHIIDGRLPHTLIAELFTDRGVGTLIQPRGFPTLPPFSAA